ncbi:dTDP-4-dehydrorhamnose reductase [Ruegeria pomeroyi]|uniref:dTDP-4-dehydrorhamnose reductase n=1 Tax=Ruegeria pomeroyi TaxID=89184 RepID=A0A9Q3WS58_9RHOB|nr:dTDP-4-dehydrorhamnose reductase [Ruegeria pomeroyi]MCE8540082.1 dTDP-4-dehydrorhamnose reductase [Ruegeria pomeroyi]
MTVLVFGQTGQLGRELARLPGTICLGRDLADFTDPFDPVTRIEDTGAEAVIIAAAYTAVDRAESEEALATTVNAQTPGAIAQACAARGLPLVYVSTDYVFDGSGEAPWHPDDATGPVNAYGRSKLAGEQAVRAAGGAHVILRTSWVVSAHGSNFVKTMLRLGRERDRLTIVADQLGGPTPARDIAAACQEIAGQLLEDPGKSGTYHFAGTPDVSWASFARETFAQAGIACEVADIPSSDYPTPARRPLNSRLDCASLEAVFGIRRPDWRAGLAGILRELGERA